MSKHTIYLTDERITSIDCEIYLINDKGFITYFNSKPPTESEMKDGVMMPPYGIVPMQHVKYISINDNSQSIKDLERVADAAEIFVVPES